MSIGQEMEISLLKISNMLNMMVLHKVYKGKRYSIYYIHNIHMYVSIIIAYVDSFI